MIHPIILKETATQVTSAQKMLFEMSLNSCTLPEDWKCSIINVIHKKGPKESVLNYRPISLTCITCQILESIIRDHLMNHFITNNLFNKKQFGFIPGRSTALQLLNVVDKWTRDLENGGQIDIVYTDFEKAFAKVPHQRLLSKLVSYGVSCNLVNGLKCSYILEITKLESMENSLNVRQLLVVYHKEVSRDHFCLLFI